MQGETYFTCPPKHGIFVRCDKLIQDRRGRAMRNYKNELAQNNNKHHPTIYRTRSRGENLNESRHSKPSK